MNELKLSVKPKQEPTESQCLRSSGYSVKINDWELGRGVTDFKLEMSADKKPKATVTFTPDILEVDDVAVDLQILGAFDRAYSDFIAKTQNEQEQSEQRLQDVAKPLSIIERYISLRQLFTQKGWEEINNLYNYQLNEKERNLSKDITLNDSEIDAFRKHAQRAIGVI
ncbi:hypothetical protein [Streptococcus cristatus]|jgi:hypothetical protein|uniref:hypothetical protein n=1 Tax=Streptococcus cristatus TaxID=45634 RepID=UPI0011F19F6A|nr:hypothetical protein [Streptococcus cristatus]